MDLTKEQKKAIAESLAKMSSADLKALANLNNTFTPNLKRLKKEEPKKIAQELMGIMGWD